MIAIVSHDAGGAEILSSWLRQNPQPYCLVLDGPAVAIFQRKLGVCVNYSLACAISVCDWVLCGTSWQSMLEKQAIVKAKVAGKKVIAFLDHWTNYTNRFQLDGIVVLPDEIWVGDHDAKVIALNLFPEIKVTLIKNPYFKEFHSYFKAAKESKHKSKQCSILYVCEPIREHARLVYGDERYWGYTEEDALKYFLGNIDALGSSISSIEIRPHPSEDKNKYDWTMEANSLVKDKLSTKSLVEQIMDADLVVGCGSMAMVLALFAKKRVISSIPPGGKVCSLPQVEIEHLQVLVTKYRDILDA